MTRLQQSSLLINFHQKNIGIQCMFMYCLFQALNGENWVFILSSHSVNSYRASVCQALGVLFFLPFIIVPCPVFLIISLSKCLEDTLKVWDNISNLKNVQGIVGAIRAPPTPLRRKAWEGVKNIKMQENTCEEWYFLQHSRAYSRIHLLTKHLLGPFSRFWDIVVNTQTRSLPSLSLYLL